MPIPWKFVLLVLAVVAIIGITYRAGHAAGAASVQVKLSALQSSLSSQAALQATKNREVEEREHADSAARLALAAELSSRVDAYADLAQRLRAATASANANVVPKAGSGPSPRAPEPQGACDARRIDAAVQSVFDAARKDAIALQVLGSKTLCECAK